MRPQKRREYAARVAQAVLLYLVGGVVVWAPVFFDSLDDYETIPVWWYVENIATWPAGGSIGFVFAVLTVVFVLFGLAKIGLWLVSQFRTTLSEVPSRRAFIGFVLLTVVLGVGVGAAVNPQSLMEHRQCQDLPDSAFITYEAVYRQPSGELMYFAGGSHLWMYEGHGEKADWHFEWKSGGYGRNGDAYEADVERDGGHYYVIANDSSLTIYEKGRTAIGTQGATVKSQYEFVAECRGESDI